MLDIFVNTLRSPERKRLGAELKGARQRALQRADDDDARRAMVESLFAEAEQAQSGGDLDAGWRFLHEAERLAVHNLLPHELSALAEGLAKENDAKKEMRDAAWRHVAISGLVRGYETLVTDAEKKSWIIEALRIRDEGAANTYFKMRTIRRQIALISIVLSIFIAVFIIIQACAPTLQQNEPVTIWTILIGIILGGIGACLSALISFAGTRPTERIPETLMAVSVTLTRPLIGMVSGLVAVLAARAGILKSTDGLLGLAPLALGFSERLVMGTLGKIR